MKYYTDKPKRVKVFASNENNKHNKEKKTKKTGIVLLFLILLINIFLYYFNKKMLPVAMDMAEIKVTEEATNLINQESVKIFSENFNYEELIKIEKDEEGNITLIRADTAMQNYLASLVVINCNERLKELEQLGVRVSLGYLTNNTFFYEVGPRVNIKLKQVGNINTSYESVFESAGINQTRHKIYLNVDMNIRVIVPLNTKDVNIKCQIPVSDTIIVGKVPDTAINMNDNSGVSQ